MFDIVEYLTDKGCVVKPAGQGNVRTHCPFHNEPPEKPGRLYIQIEDELKWGVWYCFKCGEKGNFNKIRKHFGDEPIKLTSTDEYNPIVEVAAQYYHERLFENYDAYLYLTEERGLTEEIIIQARIGWADGNLSSHLLSKGFLPDQIKDSGLVNQYNSDRFKDKIIFPYFQFGRATQLRGKTIGGITESVGGSHAQLYFADSILGENTVYLCEGETDVLTMQQMGYNAIGVPGVHTWKDEWSELVIDAKRIYIIFDQDAAGRSGAEKVAGILGPRSRIVNLPHKGLDVNDWYVKYGKRQEDFEYLFSKAKGGLLVTVQQSFERWTEIEGNGDLVGQRFNIGPLDKAMTHGLLPGQVVTLLARTNVGKSLWTINMMHRMRMADPEFKVLFFSLEQGRNEWFERAHRIHNFYDPGVSVIDTVNYWKDSMLLVDKNRVTESQLVDCVEQYTYEKGDPADLVVVDYLGYYARSFPGNSKEQTTDAIMGLKAVGRDLETVFFTPHQANRTGALGEQLAMDMAKDAATVEETSDLMLGIWAPDQVVTSENQDKSGEVIQQILKSRDGGVGTRMKYLFAPLTLAMVPFDDPLYERAVAERAYSAAGDTWKQAVERHKTGAVLL